MREIHSCGIVAELAVILLLETYLWYIGSLVKRYLSELMPTFTFCKDLLRWNITVAASSIYRFSMTEEHTVSDSDLSPYMGSTQVLALKYANEFVAK